ncbi:hypothetical protein BHE74_00047590 [Ensete ventricosum]|nr:hypothetical protein BHE74_00047590 [Ensete ventricosum]RZS20677.1 hypothetical protein BHM03_00053218 [Ensete ventricosum]
MKIRNRLSYRRLEKLAYIHYNMQLRLQCAELDKELKETKIDPIDLQFYNKDSEWVEVVENQEDPLLDEAEDPQHLSGFIIEAIKKEKAHLQQEENPPQSECGGRSWTRSSQTALGTRDTQPSQSSTQRIKATAKPKAKAKGKAATSATPLERIESGDKTPLQLHLTTHSVQRHSNDVDSSASIDDSGDVGETIFSST